MDRESRELVLWYCFPLFTLGSRILKCPFLLFWLFFRVVLPVLLPVALLGTTSGSTSGTISGCISGYYFWLHFRALLQNEKGIAIHFLCKTSCPPRTFHHLCEGGNLNSAVERYTPPLCGTKITKPPPQEVRLGAGQWRKLLTPIFARKSYLHPSFRATQKLPAP